MTFFKQKTHPLKHPPIPVTEQTEARLQADICQWFWNSFPNERQMLFHVNNKARNAIEGNKFKAMGVIKGVSDLVLILPMGRVIWIELKTPTGTQQPAQQQFEAKVKQRGHTYLIIRSLEEFQKLVIEVLPQSQPKSQPQTTPPPQTQTQTQTLKPNIQTNPKPNIQTGGTPWN